LAESTLATRPATIANDTPGQLLQSNSLLHVNDPNGLFMSDEVTRVHDAVSAVVGVKRNWCAVWARW